jgi:hypothetical protein
MKSKSDEILTELDSVFKDSERPSIIYASFDTDKNVEVDSERKQIQHDFENEVRDKMSYYKCFMMIVDGALISEKAYFYFLPRLARAVIEENGNEILLLIRLKQMNLKMLSPEKKQAVAKLIEFLSKLEKEREEIE